MGGIDHQIEASQRFAQTVDSAEPADADLADRKSRIGHATGERAHDLDAVGNETLGQRASFSGSAQEQ
jgi:hypothetical protein